MASHGVRELVSVRDLEAGRFEVRFELECGCELTREVPGDRVLEVTGGGRLLVGKYPCPVGHLAAPKK
ncbi:MAG TPA: hypothetical protein VML75_04020 [Kofleriaceae bacterium]|nr:hypothetical protein [Kofleriaceae bacterium]